MTANVLLSIVVPLYECVLSSPMSVPDQQGSVVKLSKNFFKNCFFTQFQMERWIPFAMGGTLQDRTCKLLGAQSAFHGCPVEEDWAL